MRRRHGFTIIELLVSMALILFIMVVLSEAFAAGLETFRQLKALGDMQEKMRAVSVVMRRDLAADHFGEVRGYRLSDQDLRSQPPPDTGYFRIAQQAIRNAQPPFDRLYQNSIWEGPDGWQVPSTRANQSWMAFTVWLHGERPDDYLTASLPSGGQYATTNQALQGLAPPEIQATQPANTMLSQWAEVGYFLKPLLQADNTQVNANGTPLFALYRRQRLLARNRSATIAAGNWPPYYDVSFPQPPNNNPVAVNDNKSINVPENRLWMVPSAPGGILNYNYQNNQPIVPSLSQTGVITIQDLAGGPGALQAGDDLLLTNVISFDIKVLEQGGDYNGTAYDGKMPPVFVDLPPTGKNQNVNFQGTYSVFDTWSKQGNYGSPTDGWNGTNANSPYHLPLKMRILAIQVTIRVWDERTEQARQMSVIQDM
jgi:prepilin-type N-terminal cleavage/methylation domain-containing protein